MSIYKTPTPDVALRDLTITERVFENLAQRPDAIVMTDGPTGTRLSAKDLMDQIKRLAGGLQSRGVGAGRTIALMAPNMPEYAIVFHGVAWAGGTITTINPTYTASEVAHQLRDSGAELLITVPMFLETAKAAAAEVADMPVFTIGEAEGAETLEALMGASQETQSPVDIENHVVVLPYSSGTTGLPKGVRLSHRNLVVNVDQIISGASFEPGEIAAAFLPFFHIYGMQALMNVHLAGGGALVTLPRFDLELFLQISQDHHARRMWIVPPVALALAKHPIVDTYDLSSVEEIFSGAAPLGGEVSDAVAKRLNCVALQGYGMTEASPVTHISPRSAPKSGSSGLATPNTDCRIVDPETGADLPVGEEGELWLRGPQVMLGYLNNEEATAETITKDGWLRTGDIARIDEDGYMFVMDRLKELIKYKGFQVAPAELEATLLTHEGITDAAVIGVPDDEAGERPVAFIVGNDKVPDADGVRAHLANTLSSYKQVHEVYFIDEVPKSASGKILRRVLRDQMQKDA